MQKHLNAVYDELIYLWVYFAGGGGQGVAKKKLMHKWFDQAFCKPEKFEGAKRQGEDNNLNTRRQTIDKQTADESWRAISIHYEIVG